MHDDSTLLRQFAADGSEDAFAELVRRHVDLVHSVAMRLTDRADLAADVAQSVFIDFANKAHSLRPDTVLAAWFHRAARLAALATRRAEGRRAVREHCAGGLLTPESTMNDADWDALRPVLDHVLDELGDCDREAVILRFFRQQSLRDVGSALGISEDAARMRIGRALESVRDRLLERNILSTAGALATLLSGNAVTPAPALLASQIAVGALAAAAATPASGLLTLVASTKLKLAAAAAVVLGFAAPLVLQNRVHQQLRFETRTLRQQLVESREQLRLAAETAERDAAELTRLRAGQSELLRLRGEVAQLRRQGARPPAAQATPVRALEAGETGDPAAPLTMADRGNAQPEDAAITAMWAITRGQEARFSELVAQPGGFPPETSLRLQSHFFRNMTNAYGGKQFLAVDRSRTNPDGRMELALRYQDPATGQTEVTHMTLRPGASGWLVDPGEPPKEFEPQLAVPEGR